MRVAEEGVNYLVIKQLEDPTSLPEPAEGESKFHLIRLDLRDPTEEKMDQIFAAYPDTKRYIVSDYIRFYNNQFKNRRDKKFYVQNRRDDNVFVFFKKNNKIAVNLDNLRDAELKLLVQDFIVVLQYIEVLVATRETWKHLYDLKGKEMTEEILHSWKGNVIFERPESEEVNV